MLSNKQLQKLAKTAVVAAEAAAAYIASQASKNHEIEHKSGVRSLATQVVTAIDLKSQQLILDQLVGSMEEFDLGLLTEELQDDGSRLVKDYFWCIDPLDGTLPFTERNAGYAVSIALVDQQGQPLIGVVTDAFHMETYQAIKGYGLLIDGMPLRFDSEKKGLLMCHFDRSFVQSTVYASTINALESASLSLGYKGLKIRTGAGAVMNALDLLDTPAGCYFKFPKPNPGGGCIWDYAATSLIYSELGLHVSDIYGNPLELNQSHSPYMNERGVIYATDLALGKELTRLYESLMKDA